MRADGSGRPGRVAEAVRIAAQRWPDRVAWRFDPGDVLTFADVDRLVAGYAQVLGERGVQAGDRVALLLANEAAFPLTWIALSLRGGASIPPTPRSKPAAAEHVLRACRASTIVTGEQFRPLLDRLPVGVPA